MKAIGTLVCILGVLLLTSAFRPNHNAGPFQYQSGSDRLLVSVALVMIGGVVWAFGAGITITGQTLGQRRLDSRAKAALRTGDFTGYALYLRPFSVKDTKLPKLGWEEHYDYFGESTLMRAFSEATQRTAPLLGFGERDEATYGFGEAGFAEQNWYRAAESAIRTSELIFVVPGYSSGVLWEVGKILETGALKKVVFVMPPESTGFGPTNDGVEKYWEKACIAFWEAYRFELPRYHYSGAVFALGDTKCRLIYLDSSQLHDPAYLVDLINTVLQEAV